MSKTGKRLTITLVLAATLALVLLFPGTVADGWRKVAQLPVRAVTRWVPPKVERTGVQRGRERRAARSLSGRLHGRIVWSSNRSGNHELYVLDVDAGEVTQLTDDPHVDFSARFSPSGDRLVFARSQQDWVSFRDESRWDLWLMRADGTGARRIVEGGYHPTWGPGGESVVFWRDNRILELSLGDGSIRVLLDPGDRFGGRALGDAMLHPAGRLLTFMVQGWGAMVGPVGGSYRRLTDEQVCQTRWVPGTEDLLWVEPHGNGGTRIVRAAADASTREVFMDLPGDRSHEYFPNISDDGRWLVWGAAAEGHEHDRADYEIYVWQVGTPWEDAVRLTYYAGNDQWPDVHVDAR